MVAQRHGKIAAEVKERGRGKGHATANGAMRALKALWNFSAERKPDLPANPVKRKRLMFKVPRRTRMVKADDLPAFYAAVCRLPNAVARDYILLMLFYGLRKTEAASLRWADVDFKAKVIRIPAASTKAGRALDLPMTDVPRHAGGPPRTRQRQVGLPEQQRRGPDHGCEISAPPGRRDDRH